jgi:hypothetical protein
MHQTCKSDFSVNLRFNLRKSARTFFLLNPVTKKAPQFPEGLPFKLGDYRILSRLMRDSHKRSTIGAEVRVA